MYLYVCMDIYTYLHIYVVMYSYAREGITQIKVASIIECSTGTPSSVARCARSFALAYCVYTYVHVYIYIIYIYIICVSVHICTHIYIYTHKSTQTHAETHRDTQKHTHERGQKIGTKVCAFDIFRHGRVQNRPHSTRTQI